jgi:Resolvase, N terminal domain
VTLFDDTGSSSVIPTADSTLCGVHGIDSRYMKRAVLYARVSTDAQQKEATIESQLFELKKHITEAGHVLVKEYIDNGYSGTLLDRPALEQLRADLKTDLFDVIYFPNVDRIARDAAQPHTPSYVPSITPTHWVHTQDAGVPSQKCEPNQCFAALAVGIISGLTLFCFWSFLLRCDLPIADWLLEITSRALQSSYASKTARVAVDDPTRVETH